VCATTVRTPEPECSCSRAHRERVALIRVEAELFAVASHMHRDGAHILAVCRSGSWLRAAGPRHVRRRLVDE